jgi:hypothetical protein
MTGLEDLYHGRIMNAWGEQMNLRAGSIEDSRTWVAHVTHFGRIMAPAMDAAELILADPDLASRHADWAYKVLRFFQTGFQQFEMDRREVLDGSLSWYWRPLDDEWEPLNHVTSLGRALMPVAEMTGDPVYRRRVQEILDVFDLSLAREEDGTVSWPYSPVFQTPTARDPVDRMYSEYTWKGSITLPFVLDAARRGYDVPPETISGIRQLLVGYVLADGVWKRNMHPINAAELRESDPPSLMAALGGFHVSFPDDAEIAQLVLEMLVKNPDMYPLGLLSHTGLARSYATFLPLSAESAAGTAGQ